jgi:hypothetical protein
MRKITIEIKTENDAFQDNECGETARILRDLARYIEVEHAQDLENASPVRLFDRNGNRVGSCVVKP